MAKKRKRSRSLTAKTTGPKTIKTKMTKSQLTAYLVSYVEHNEEEITSAITSKEMRRLVTATMDRSLAGLIILVHDVGVHRL